MKKRLIPALLLLALLAGALWLGPSFKDKGPAAPSTPAASNQAGPSVSARPQPPLATADAPVSGPVTPAAQATATPAPPPAKVEATASLPPASGKPVTTLSELYRAFDAIDVAADDAAPSSLATLVSYAATDNVDIRSAAIAGLIRRGDAAAAPLLRAAAKQTDSSKQVIELLQTADYLELPPVDPTKLAARIRPARDPNAPKRPPPPDRKKPEPSAP